MLRFRSKGSAILLVLLVLLVLLYWDYLSNMDMVHLNTFIEKALKQHIIMLKPVCLTYRDIEE